MASNSPSTTKGSTPIRAPITVDDDSTDFESLTESVYSETSGSIYNGSEFDEYASGGEEFETASEKPFADEENREETRPSVNYELSRPFVVDPDEQSLENSVTDEESSVNGDNALGVPSLQPGMPIAQLSIEEDEFNELISDEDMVSEEEEDGSIRAIARVDSAPRVRVENKDDEFLFPSDKSEVNGSTVDDSISVAGLGEKREGVLIENAGGLKHVFDDSVSVNVVKPKVCIESLVEKKDDVWKQNVNADSKFIVDLGLEDTELIRGDDLNPKNLEIDCAGKEQIGETIDVFVESELTQVHNILAELQELNVDSSNNVSEAVIDPIDDSEAEEATSFIDGSVVLEEDNDTENLEDLTAQQNGMIHESVEIEDAVCVDSVENLDLLEASKEETAVQGSFLSDAEIENIIYGGSEPNFMNELEGSSSISPIADDREIVSDSGSDSGSDSEMEMNKETEGNDLFDPATFATLLGASGAELDGGKITLTSEDGRVFWVQRPIQPDTVKDGPSEELIEKIQHIRVKFLRLVHRLGLSPEDSVVAQVLYRLALSVKERVSDAESAKKMALQLEAEVDKLDLGFSLTILVIGKTGVGKSATINSIFGEKRVAINAFEHATSTVKEIVGMINGVRIRVFDTPGLRSPKEEAANRKILASIKRLTKKFPPDVVLYVDRLDTYATDFSDLPLLGSVTNSLTASIWRNAIVTLTHAAAVTPDGPFGSPMSLETFVARRSHVVQQVISQAVGDIRLMDSSMMHPVALIENHPILSVCQSWRPQLLLLCYSLKILSEANSITKSRNQNHEKRLGLGLRSLPLPHLLASMLQSRSHLKLQGGDDFDSDIELLDLSDNEDEFEQLPSFKPLNKSEVDKLIPEHRRAYFEEYDCRVNLLQRKQLKEEVKRLKELKNKPKDSLENTSQEEEEEGPATVPVAMADFSLPLSFDCGIPSYRYRALENIPNLLVRPVLDLHCWDHDFGYDGVNVEGNLTIAESFPGELSIQITKDKKEFNLQLDSSICAKHGESRSTMAGFDIHRIGRNLAYILRSDTQIKNSKQNKTSGGLWLTLAGQNVATGLKIEDEISFGKQLAVTGSAGAVRSKGETALGANFQIRLKSRDYPLNQDQSTLGFSLMKWRGDLGLTANLQSQFSVGRNSRMAIGVGMNNKQSGQISIKTSSSELQIAAIWIFPVLASIVRNLCSGSAAKDSNLLG